MVLLQILDEGSITDLQGRKVDFKNTIICLTSNLVSDILAHSSTSGPDARAEVFERTAELDSMRVFNQLSRASTLRGVDFRLADVVERLRHRRIVLDADARASGF
ncbi:hypothetical protein V8D89_004873 [Ganoderma adspersum]